MWRAPRAFSRVCKGISYIASSSVKKDKPAFKPLQGNLSFFRVRASWYPLYLGSNLRVPLTYVLLREGYS